MPKPNKLHTHIATGMHIRVQLFKGELYPTLSLGTVYPVLKGPDAKGRVVILDDSNQRMSTNLYQSGYLNGGSFEIIKEGRNL